MKSYERIINLSENGFLTEQYKFLINREKYEQYLELSMKINTFAYKKYDYINVHNNNAKEVFITCSFAKIHKDYQSVILLSERGLIEQGKVMLRCLLEKLFVLVAIFKDDNNWVDWKNDQLYRKKKIMEAINRGDKGLENLKLDGFSEENFINAKSITIKEWSKRADMEEAYNMIYKLFSGNVHLSEEAIVEDILFDLNGDMIEAISVAPKEEDLAKLLVTNMNYMLLAIDIIQDGFHISKKDMESLREDFNRLAATI